MLFTIGIFFLISISYVSYTHEDWTFYRYEVITIDFNHFIHPRIFNPHGSMTESFFDRIDLKINEN